MRISDWSSDVCSSDLVLPAQCLYIIDRRTQPDRLDDRRCAGLEAVRRILECRLLLGDGRDHVPPAHVGRHGRQQGALAVEHADSGRAIHLVPSEGVEIGVECLHRSEEHTSELQSLMRISYAVFCLKKKKIT